MSLDTHTRNEIALADLLDERVRAYIDNDRLPASEVIAQIHTLESGCDQLRKIDRVAASFLKQADDLRISTILAAVSPTKRARLSAIRMAIKLCAVRYAESLDNEAAA